MNKHPESILAEALRVTGGGRQDNYGHPIANHRRIALLWNAYLSARAVDNDPAAPPKVESLDPTDVVHMMILLKIARELHSDGRDNWVDMAGYARCGSRMNGHEP